MSGGCRDRCGGSRWGQDRWRGAKIGTAMVDSVVEGRSRTEVAKGGCGGGRCSQGRQSYSGGVL